MSMPSHESACDLTHQQSHIIDYINEIAQELAQMADRAGCGTLGHDLRQALLSAHGIRERTSGDGRLLSNGLDDERSQKQL